MTFPKRSKIIDESQIKIEHKYLIQKYELILDRLRCVGCGQCSIVCPTDAILFGPAAAVYENKPKSLNAAVVDSIEPDLCTMCGTCVAFCPFDAIHVIKNGEKVDPETLRIITYNSIPHLDAKPFACSRIKRDAQVYWEGETKATYEMPATEEEFKKYYLNKCPTI